MDERKAEIREEIRQRYPEGSNDPTHLESAVEDLIELRAENEELQCK